MSAIHELGLIGLGTMGRNFLLNLADHGVPVAGYDRDQAKVGSLASAASEASAGKIKACQSLKDLVGSLKPPRVVLMLVPAGDPVDQVIADLEPLLSEGDLIIDGGNSHFTDTRERQSRLTERGLVFMGLGISGGSEGARHGPSLMPGGDPAAYRRVHPILEKAAAKVDGEPCVAHLGAGASGHHVKMVHNGIEYGLMQLLAESYDLLRRAGGLGPSQLAEVFDAWVQGPASGYLVEITADIFKQPDNLGEGFLLDAIADQAAQKGTGKWTSQDAMDLGVPTPLIDAAVSARSLSADRNLRLDAARKLSGPNPAQSTDPQSLIAALTKAWHAAALIAYAEGLALIRAASTEYGFGVHPATVVRVWRGGCIIRSRLLDPIGQALQKNEDLPHLLLAEELGATVADRQEALRNVVRTAAETGVPAPAFAAALFHFDGLRTPRLPANLTQAQRDVFGSHGFRRLDREGDFHGDWKKE